MFGLLKMLFYTFVAVVVGVFIGTVPVGGRTIAERITSAYQGLPEVNVGGSSRPAKAEPRTTAAKASSRPAKAAAAAKAPTASASKPAAASVTAGAANTPDAHTADDRAAVERLIAARSKR